MSQGQVAQVLDHLVGLQNAIVNGLETIDGRAFSRDAWVKEAGGPIEGGGTTCILEDSNVFERGGVGLSHVRGATLPPSAAANRPEVAGRAWEALGVSLVMHPKNPYCPTVHMNVRFFIAAPRAGEAGEPVWWFGGGMDLTPYYGFEKDAVRFHAACKDALAPFGEHHYPRYKKWCDEYFYLKHRNEPRGIGGIFYDDFSEGGFDHAFAMMRSVSEAFLPVYQEIIERRRATPWGERERAWQLMRRGRYVEFNLVWDRGTHFGLQSGGRTESILMSMPPHATWTYAHAPEPGSAEASLLSDFLCAKDWL